MEKLVKEVIFLCRRYEIVNAGLWRIGDFRVEVAFDLDVLDHGKLAVLFSSFDKRYEMRKVSLEDRVLTYGLTVFDSDRARYDGGEFDISEMADRDYRTETEGMFEATYKGIVDEYYDRVLNEQYDRVMNEWTDGLYGSYELDPETRKRIMEGLRDDV